TRWRPPTSTLFPYTTLFRSPLNEYRSAKKLVPRMGEVQSVVASAPALTSPAPIGTSVNTPQVMLTAVKLRDSAWVNVAKPGENTYSGLNVTWYSVPGSKPPWLQIGTAYV